MAAVRPPAYSEPDLIVVTDGTRHPVDHETTVVEAGAFARAACATCGWTGPARRARSVATVDLAEHLAGGAER